ncbi:MAG: hypothetical protein ACXWFC_10020 [Nitrososphaeraceae archaeon]
MNTSKVIIEKISFIDSEEVTKNMHEKGYALVPRFLPGQYCKELISEYDSSFLITRLRA